VVIAYLMRHKGWQLHQSYQWVKDRRPSINLTPAVEKQLQEYEIEVFGNTATANAPMLNTPGMVSFGFGYPTPPPQAELPMFTSQPDPSTSLTSPSFFYGPGRSDSVALNTNFVFGAVRQEQPVARAAMDHSMDSS
jgi:dual specificity MAP kinase phosphatase